MHMQFISIWSFEIVQNHIEEPESEIRSLKKLLKFIFFIAYRCYSIFRSFLMANCYKSIQMKEN